MLLAVAFLFGSLGYYVGEGRRPSRGSVDVGFQQDMISHHEQALEMALVAVERADDAQVRGFAREILVAQSREIGFMISSLNRWGFEPGEPDRTVMAWMGMAMPARSMPGLASPAQMTNLLDASGKQASSLFLQLMTAHHRGGVAMAKEAAERAKDSTVRAIASSMARNQTLEIDEYLRLLRRIDPNAPVLLVPSGATDGAHGADHTGESSP